MEPAYPAAQAGLARLDAGRGRFAPAIRRYRQVVERIPLPEYAVALAETEQAAGRVAAARRDYALVEAEAQLLRSNGVNADVDLALFEAEPRGSVAGPDAGQAGLGGRAQRPLRRRLLVGALRGGSHRARAPALRAGDAARLS